MSVMVGDAVCGLADDAGLLSRLLIQVGWSSTASSVKDSERVIVLGLD